MASTARIPCAIRGGLLGGSWLAAFTSDLGNGKFDGAWLVQNFENLNPANTLWTKQYDLYSKIDTEAARYLEFERWWGGHVNINAEEIQFIVDQLFVGNKLAAGKSNPGRQRVDLRNIRSPIVVFCSKGDNITPPPQALGWILDLYDSADDIRAMGRPSSIPFTKGRPPRHLCIGWRRPQGIQRVFQQHRPDRCAAARPLRGDLRAQHSDTINPDLAAGDWVMRCELAPSTTSARLVPIRGRRSLLRGGGPGLRDQSRALSHLRPAVRAGACQPSDRGLDAEFHPLRLTFELFSDANPMMAMLKPMSAWARDRNPAAGQSVSRVAGKCIPTDHCSPDLARPAGQLAEQTFLGFYGSPVIRRRSASTPSTQPLRKPGKNPLHEAVTAADRREGAVDNRRTARSVDPRAALCRRRARAVDERGFELMRRIRRDYDRHKLTLPEFKEIVRDHSRCCDRPGSRARGDSGLLPNDWRAPAGVRAWRA